MVVLLVVVLPLVLLLFVFSGFEDNTIAGLATLALLLSLINPLTSGVWTEA